MNIFYQNSTEHTIATHTYYEINEPVYCFSHGTNWSMFTQDKKIIFEAYQLNYTLWPWHYLLHQLKGLSKFFEMKHNASQIESKITLTQHFAFGYGHFCDEIFDSYDFNRQFNSESFHLVNNYKKKNLNELARILYDKKFLNIQDYESGIVIPKCILIKHTMDMDTWHSLPISSTLKILDTIEENDFNHANIFLSKERGGHRNLFNLIDIENELEKAGFFIHINERHSYIDNVKIIQNARNIVTTWGSALVNLAFAKPCQKIVVLRSSAYYGENISLFRNLIKTHNLNLKIINAVDNIIKPSQINDAFENFNIIV
jgi:capsular polysaccharide biosynthesis protein